MIACRSCGKLDDTIETSFYGLTGAAAMCAECRKFGRPPATPSPTESTARSIIEYLWETIDETIINGWSSPPTYDSLAAWLNARGSRTTQGRMWTYFNLRRVTEVIGFDYNKEWWRCYRDRKVELSERANMLQMRGNE
jgi:hypothetical protein